MMPIQALRMRNANASPYGSHRYWRVFSSANNGNSTQTGIADVEFRSTAGGSDLTGSGTALSGGSGSDVSAPSGAYDGDLNNGWVRSATSSVWIGYDFGSAVAVAEVQLRALNTSPDRNIKTGTVDYSDDGTNWTTAFSFSIWAWTPNQNRTLPEAAIASGYYRSLRINITSLDGGSNAAIAEIEFRASIGGADQATGGNAVASSTNTTFVASNAFANDGTSSQWVGVGVANWIRYDFPSPVQLLEATIQAVTTSFNRSPKDFTIEGSNDGSTWATLFSPSSQTGWTSGQTRTFH
jgi:hypothetical protein